MRGYGALPAEMIESHSQSNTRQRQDIYSQEIERTNRGKWEIISGVKHVFTRTILGKARTEPKEERNSFLIVSLAEMDISALNEQSKTSLTSTTLTSTGDKDEYSIHDENSSALTETTSEHIGESNNY